jgi:hypothetical protein
MVVGFPDIAMKMVATSAARKGKRIEIMMF